MKKLLIFLLIPVLCSAQGINFQENTFNQLLSKAKKENKILFIDAYAVWCGPCKNMSKNVFTEALVGKFYNTNFINAKIDMEKGEGIIIAANYNVTAYPTLLFIDENGKLLHKIVGFKNPEEFINVGKAALNPTTQSYTQIEKFNTGNRDPGFLYDLAVEALNNNEKDASVYARAYYKTQKNLMTLKTVVLMYLTIDNPLSEEFIFLQKNEVEAENLYQENSISDRLDNVVLEYAIDLLIQNQPNTITIQNSIMAVEKTILKYRPNKVKDLTNYFGMLYSKEQNKYMLFEKYALTYLEKNYKAKNYSFLNEIAWCFFEQVENKNSLKEALKWALESVEQESYSYNNDTVANLYYKLGDNSNARIFAKKAIKLGEENGEDTTETEALLLKLK
jgi:thioredoxin-related protein